PLFGIEKLDRFQADGLGRRAQLVEREIAVAPFAHGLLEVALEGAVLGVGRLARGARGYGGAGRGGKGGQRRAPVDGRVVCHGVRSFEWVKFSLFHTAHPRASRRALSRA